VPIPDTQSSFGGEDDEGGGEVVASLSSDFQGSSSPSKEDA